MRAEGLASQPDRAFATDIVHEGNLPHSQMSAFAAEHGCEIAHDGMSLAV
jgi:hypothetical protein